MPNNVQSCDHCGHENPPVRFWCDKCNAQLERNPASVPPDRASTFDRRKTLYEELRSDLSDLRSQSQLPTESFESVNRFCHHQLDQIAADQKADICERRFLKQVETARHLAHAGKRESAIAILRSLPVDDRQKQTAEELIGQVQNRINSLHQAAVARKAAIEEERQQQEARIKAERERLSSPPSPPPSLKSTLSENSDLRQIEQRTSQICRIEASPVKEAAISRATSQQPGPTQDVGRPSAPGIEPQPESHSVHSAASTANEPVTPMAAPVPSFDRKEAVEASPTSRLVESASKWSTAVKPFLVDNVGWFVGSFLVLAGFAILILTFWTTIESNQILMHSLVFASLASATAAFFAIASLIRKRYPQLESSSNVLMVLVTLMIPLVFAAATLPTLIPRAAAAATSTELATPAATVSPTPSR